MVPEQKGVETFVYNRREGRNQHISYLSGASPFIYFPVCVLPLYVQGWALVYFECLPAYEKRLSMQRVIVAPGNSLIFLFCCRYGPCYPLLYCFLSSMTPSLDQTTVMPAVSVQKFCLALHLKPKVPFSIVEIS